MAFYITDLISGLQAGCAVMELNLIYTCTISPISPKCYTMLTHDVPDRIPSVGQ